MGKRQRFFGAEQDRLASIFPVEFDQVEINRFFEGKAGVSDDVLEAIELALDGVGPERGQTIAAAAREDVSETEADSVDFVSYLTTTQDHMLSHEHGHSHDDGHVCDGNCGEDCPHAQEDDDSAAIEFAGLANAKPEHAKGNKTSPDEDGGTSTKGGGKGKKDRTNQEPVPEEPAPDPVSEEPAPDPVPDVPVIEEAAPDFGWLDSNSYLSGGDTLDGFNLLLNFDGSWTQNQLDVGAAMAEQISDFIIGDLVDYNGVDDISIRLWNENIDGAGNIWGQGGWYNLRSDGMVATGGVRLDSSDLSNVEAMGLLDELFLHEMLHAIGFGTTWGRDGLVSGGSYIGQNGTDVYGGPIPYDNAGHLAESVGDEMGTTFISDGKENVTDLTLAILQDMGFQTISSMDEFGFV